MDLYSQGYERSYTVNSSILNAIEPHLKDFQQLLLDPPKVDRAIWNRGGEKKKNPSIFSFHISVFKKSGGSCDPRVWRLEKLSFIIWCMQNFEEQMETISALFSEKCNIDNRRRSGATTRERPPSCGPVSGRSAADQWSQYLPGALQSIHHWCITGICLLYYTHAHIFVIRIAEGFMLMRWQPERRTVGGSYFTLANRVKLITS